MDRLSFTDRLGLLMDREASERENKAPKSRLHRVKLNQMACMEDIDCQTSRGLNQRQMLNLSRCRLDSSTSQYHSHGSDGNGEKLSCLCTRTQGVSRGLYGCYHRLPRLLEESSLVRADGRYLKFLRTLSRLDDLILDD